MFSVSNLRKAAAYGAVLSCTGCSILYYKMQSRLASGEFYTKPVEALRADERLTRAIGPPIKTLFLNLGNKDNFVTQDKSQLSIPVKGTKYKGILHSRCSRIEGSNTWNIETLILEVNGKEVSVKFTNKTDDEELVS